MEKHLVKAFDKLYDTFSDQVFRYFSMRLNNREKAIDLTQETFVRLWNSYYRQGKEIKYEKALLFRVAHNLLVNTYERDRAHISLDSLSEEGYEPDDQESVNVEDLIEGEMIKSSLDELPFIYKEVLFLRFVEDLPVKEISEIMDLTENVVSVRIHRGLQKLKEIYDKK